MSIIIKRAPNIHNETEQKSGILNVRYDDTINTIKQKIITTRSLKISVDSIYLFTEKSKTLYSELVFKELTKSRRKFNILDGKDINVLKLNCGEEMISSEKKFNYKDFKKEFEGNKTCKIPLGHSIYYKTNYAFVVNPYNLILQGKDEDANDKKIWDTFLFDQDNNKNLIKYSGEKLLFEYLDHSDKENTIYYCTAQQFWEDIKNLDKIDRKDDFYKYILQIYFPKLFYGKEIIKYKENMDVKKIAISGEDPEIQKWRKNHQKIDHFYDFEKKKYG